MLRNRLSPSLLAVFCQFRESGSLTVRKKALRIVKSESRKRDGSIAKRPNLHLAKGIKSPFRGELPSKEEVSDALNNAIVTFFQKPPKENPQAALDQLIESNKNPNVDSLMKFTSSNISSLVFIAAKQKNQFGRNLKNNLSIAHHAPYIVKVLESESNEKFTNRDLSNICFGIKSIGSLKALPKGVISGDDTVDSSKALQISLKSAKTSSLATSPEIVEKFLSIVSSKLDGFEGELTKVDAGKIVCGLQGLRSESTAVKGLVRSISRCLTRSLKGEELTQMNAVAIGTSLYGLQGLSSSHEEVRELVKVISSIIKQSERHLDGKAMAGLYGLQRLTTNYPEVRELVGILAEKINESHSEMTAQELSSAFLGLKCFTSSTKEVRDLLAALNEKLGECDEQFKPQVIGNILLGLRGMDSEHDEVKDVLLALVKKIERCPRLDQKAVVQACSGLKHFNAKHTEVRLVLAALRLKMLRSKDKLNAEDIRLCINGVRQLYFNTNAAEAEEINGKKVYKNLRSSYYDVEAFVEALRSISPDPELVNDLLLKYANKAEWHLKGIQRH